MANVKRTKAEQAILDQVTEMNRRGALCGLRTKPSEAEFTSHENRFVRRLYERGEIVWIDWTPHLGAGWSLPGTTWS